MAFKKSLSALIVALPLVLAFNVNRDTATLNPKCAFLEPIRDDLLKNLFIGECGDSAHGALRMLFHDSIGIDPVLGGGGADGSIAVFNSTELTFPANDGLDDVFVKLGPFLHKYSDVLSPGDFIQFAGALSLTFCPGAPRVKFAFGRPQPTAASPPNLVPEPFDSTTKILARFASVGFSPQEVVAVLASHTVAGADTVDPSIPGTPFDSTPAVFDTTMFIEVLLHGLVFPGNTTTGLKGEVLSSVRGTMRLQSDFEIARDSRTACFWQDLANDQAAMQQQFADGLYKLSLLGQNIKHLTDCSAVIPQPKTLAAKPSFPPGQTVKDIKQSCTTAKFPNLPTLPGPPLVVPPIPQAASSSGS